jgi:hypothetical protein
LLDFPFNRRKRTCKVCLRFQRCHWRRWNSAKNSVVNVPMKFFTLPSPWFQRCQLHRWNRFSGVNDTAEIVSAVSMTSLKFEYNRFSRRIRSHMLDGFRAWIRVLGGIVWWKKPRD